MSTTEKTIISTGAVFHGPELKGSKIDLAFMALAKALEEFQGPARLGDSPSVVAVFMVPGSLGDCDFEGLRYGSYSRKHSAIVVQIAVPAALVDSSNTVPFFIDALHRVNAMTFEFFTKKKKSFPMREAEDLVDSTANLLQGYCQEG